MNATDLSWLIVVLYIQYLEEVTCTLILACPATSSCMTSTWLHNVALCSAVSPSSFAAFGFAPLSIKYLTMSSAPLSAAWCSAVLPASSSGPSISSPRLISRLTPSRSPSAAQTCSVEPVTCLQQNKDEYSIFLCYRRTHPKSSLEAWNLEVKLDAISTDTLAKFQVQSKALCIAIPVTQRDTARMYIVRWPFNLLDKARRWLTQAKGVDIAGHCTASIRFAEISFTVKAIGILYVSVKRLWASNKSIRPSKLIFDGSEETRTPGAWAV